MQHTMKKTISILLSLVMLLSVFAGMSFTASAANTYQISTYAELKAFAAAVNSGETDANAILTENIIAEGADLTAEGTGWTPIGDLAHPYIGTFDGDGHTITGLSTESSAGRDYVGLFGFVDEGGVVQNVGLVGGSIKGQTLVGAVAGENEGKIINCYNTGTVQSTDDSSIVGGVVGRNIEGTVQSCYNTGTVSGLIAYAGGVVGYNTEGTVQNCYNTGDVNGAIVGGVAGFNTAENGGSAEISNCFNTGKISGTNMVGGVAGHNFTEEYLGTSSKATITNCYNMGAVSVTNGSEVGGVVGRNHQDSGCPAEVTNCYSAGTVTASGFGIDAGGVIGWSSYGAVQNCYYDSDVCAANNNIGTRLTTAQMTGMDALSNMPGLSSVKWLVRASDEFYNYYPHLKGFAYDDTATAKEWPARKVKDGAMEISNYDELKAFAAAVNGGQTGLKAILKSDIAATDKDWTPIGNKSNPYVGAFDGGGHTITGLSNEEAAATPDSAGLFGYLGENATVKNVRLTGVDLKATSYLGAVAGDAKGAEITNCRNTGEINCTTSEVGGIIGGIHGAIVSNCCNTGDITSTANNAYVGGIAGYLCGDQSAAGITNCYNTGTVTGKGRYSNVGGIAGYANDIIGTVEIANCYNTGAVTATGTSSRAGGIAASSCVFSGGTVEVINCYSAGAVTADQNVGGVVGLKYDSVVRNCWYDDNVCNLSSAVGSVADTDDVRGLHMCEMTGTGALTQMPFSEPSAWLVKENSDICVFYPHLKGFDLNADGDQMEASAIDPADWPAKRNHSHTYGAPVWSWEKDHSKATASFTCSACGDLQTVTDNAPTFENGQFTATVEFQNNPYTDTVSWRTGDLITFGGYPQTQVTDQDTKDALAAKLADEKWVSYRYYTGTGSQDGQMQPGDWMRWQDVLLNGERYRAVTFDDYRPTYTSKPSSADNSHQDENGYEPGQTYYFKFESLQWRVLDPSAGLVLCESIIDAQAFQNVMNRQEEGSSWNNYAESSIRDWLLNDFYNTAFSAAEQALIASVPLRECGVDADKVFLLSSSEASKTAYGFSTDTTSATPSRTAQGTDYAKCQGLSVSQDNSRWWLRYTKNLSSNVSMVTNQGIIAFSLVVVTYIGVRPAFRFASGLTASSNPNGYCEPGEPEETELTSATCAADGEKKITVKCIFHGETISETTEPIPATGAHTYGDTGDDRFTCTVCGQVDDALKAAAELADAKEAAKTELAGYADASDYRPAQQTELTAAVDAGNGEIDAAADLDAVNAALANAKADVDAIKTDAELTAEETLAADKAAFDEYKTAQKAEAERLLQEGDSAESAALVETAKKAIDNTAYNEGANLAANKSVIDAIISGLTEDLAAQRASEGAASYQSRPCPICGKTHSAGGVDNMLGEFHWYTYMFKYIFYSFLSIIGYDAPYAALKG